MTQDEAKQLLYLEENRAYRNAFKLDSMGATATEEENMRNTSPSIEIGVEYEITHSVSLSEPITKESGSIKHGKGCECCEDFNSRVEYAPNHLWNGS